MSEEYATEIKQLKKKYTILYIVSIAILAGLFFLLSAFVPRIFHFNDNSQLLQPELYHDHQLLVQDGVLHTGFLKLQQLDGNFAMMITDSSKREQIDSINRLIISAEAAFVKTLDSIEYQNKSNKGNSQEISRDITATFREELGNRRIMANLRIALSMGTKTFSNDQQMLMLSQNGVLEKQKRIESLENDLKSWQLNAYNNSKPDAVSALLKQDNETLQSAYKEQDKKIVTINAALSALKLENEKLKSQAELKKNDMQADNTLKDKNTAMERQINDLSGELRLAQVDCNLSRADAQQLVSTSKQRKALLSEAQNLLNALSKTDDAVMQLRVKEKIARLKQLAATIHD